MRKAWLTNNLIIFTIALILASCLDMREGCLDPSAMNFDVSADIDGECEYPALRLSFFHLDDEGLINKGDVIYFSENDSARLSDYAYFISDIYLLLDSGDTLRSLDLFKISSASNLKSTSDVLFIDNQENSLLVGRINNSGRIIGLHLRLGLDEELKRYDPSTTAAIGFGAHSNTYFTSAEIILDTIEENYDQAYFKWLQDSTKFEVTIPNEASSFDVLLELDTTIAAGSGLSLQLAMDYTKWWNEIDLSSSSEQIILDLEANFEMSVGIIE